MYVCMYVCKVIKNVGKIGWKFCHTCFGVGKLGHEPFVTFSRLFHGLFYLLFQGSCGYGRFMGSLSVRLILHEVRVYMSCTCGTHTTCNCRSTCNTLLLLHVHVCIHVLILIILIH